MLSKHSTIFIVSLLACLVLLLPNDVLCRVYTPNELDGAEVIIGTQGNEVRLKCDLPMSQPPNILWETNSFAIDKNHVLLFNSTGEVPNEYKKYLYVNETTFEIVLFEKENNIVEESYICTSIVDGQEYQKLYNLIIIKEMKCTGETRLHEGDKAELECSIDVIYHPEIIFNYKGYVSEQWFNIPLVGRNLTFNVDYSDDKARIDCSVVPKGPQCHFDLQVLYEMMDFETPENKSLEAGEPIVCKASGNPSPTVRMSVKRTPTDDDWVFFNSSTSGSAVVYLNESYNGDSSELKCRFESALTNKIIEKIVKLNIVGSKGILGNVASKLQENNYLLLIVIIVIALVVLLIIIAIIIYKRKKNSQKKNKKAEVALLKSEPRKDYKNESV